MVKDWLFGPLLSYLSSYKFTPKKNPRRAPFTGTSFYRLPNLAWTDELGPPKIKLGNQTYAFLTGQWIAEEPPLDTPKAPISLALLEEKNKILEEENNYLKVQIEILKDMLLEAMAEVHVSEMDMKLPVIEKTMLEENPSP
ncbi:protein chibby homolog 3 [Ranitomeya imitator]|uniref:protein chibby homolog 3 n=1 Tax=Ranitomeya imitator TaxID=111125 RepID=UPI0037E8780F